MAIQLNGDLVHSSVNSLITPINLGQIETPTAHSLVISWDPNPDNNLTTSEGELKVYFDNQLLIPSGNTSQYTLLRDVKSDSTPSNNGMVYWGFTASTGAANNTQVVSFRDPLHQGITLHHFQIIRMFGKEISLRQQKQ